MKVGIITFHHAVNYGAVLQTYALQQAILNTKNNVEIINYRCPSIEEYYSPIIRTGNKIKALVKTILYYRIRKKRNQEFKNFQNKYLHLSSHVFFSSEDLKETVTQYDRIITGSDQVWNHLCAGFDPVYFLDFVPPGQKKNSYAASFGFSEIPQGYEKEYQKRLQGYQNMSVREITGAEIIKKLLNREVPVVLDPTLLLDQKEWSAVASDFEFPKDYILVYNVLPPISMLDYARELAKEQSCQVIYLNDDLLRDYDLLHSRSNSPDRFLGWIKNAKYVITNSFHGTAFSIIFHRPFITEMNGYTIKKQIKYNDRAKHLLESLELDDRMWNGRDKIDINKTIDWNSVDNLLKIQRMQSIDYLNRVVSDDDL